MKRETLIWTVLFVVGAIALAYNAATRHAGSEYVRAVERQFVNVGTDAEPQWINYNSDDALDYPQREQSFDSIPDNERISWTSFESASPGDYQQAMAADPQQKTYRFSLPRTVGTWVAALFTLFIFSFLYRDNLFYKFAESVVVGVSAAYWMVIAFWNVIIPNLLGKISPPIVHWAMPGLKEEPNYLYLAPLILGIMLLWRLSPKGPWISRWPLAFIIGTTAGIRLIGFVQADFLSQIRNTIIPLWVTTPDDGMLFWSSVKNLVIVIGVLSALVYFFFSIEHKGAVGYTARLGIWFLMVTFGAAFGYTVMGRIALLAIRLEFLFDDWLWIIDPTGQRTAELVSMLWPALPMLA